jgi:hypothetical protein
MAMTVTLVVVTASDTGAKQLWAAAASPDQAVQAVLKQIPEGWTAELAEHRLSADQVATLNLKPGEVTEFSRGMALGRRK